MTIKIALPSIQLKLLLLISILILGNMYANAKEALIFAIDIIRHGDRTPVIELPQAPHSWQEGLGELTAIGLRQEFELGRQLRKQYIDQTKLLPHDYSNASVYVRSTDYNRTLMSAEATLLGLYPLGTGPHLPHFESPALPMAYQPIPIHTVPETEDALLVPGHGQPQFRQLIKQVVIASPAWQQKSLRYKHKLSRWSEITGLPIQNLYQLMGLADNLHIRRLHGVAWPKEINEQEGQEIIRLGQWVMSSIYKPYQIGHYASKELLTNIAHNIQVAVKQQSRLRYVLYLAHDSTILAIMSALHQPLNYLPPYATDLKILLFKNSINNRYYIRISLNDKQVLLPACKIAHCPVQDFLQALK